MKKIILIFILCLFALFGCVRSVPFAYRTAYMSELVNSTSKSVDILEIYEANEKGKVLTWYAELKKLSSRMINIGDEYFGSNFDRVIIIDKQEKCRDIIQQFVNKDNSYASDVYLDQDTISMIINSCQPTLILTKNEIKQLMHFGAGKDTLLCLFLDDTGKITPRSLKEMPWEPSKHYEQYIRLCTSPSISDLPDPVFVEGKRVR